MKALAVLCALLAAVSPVSAAAVEGVALPAAPLAPIAAGATTIQAPVLSPLKAEAAAAPKDFRQLAEIPAARPAAAPAQPAAATQAALPALTAAATPAKDRASGVVAAAIFDGGHRHASLAPPVGTAASAPSSSGLAPSSAGAPRSPSGPPDAPRRSWLRRLNEATRPPSRAEAWLERGAVVGALAAAIAPVVWGAYPFHWLLLAVPTALALPAVVFGGLTAFRLGRFLVGKAPAAPRAPPTRAFRARAAFAGLALGLALGSAPAIRHADMVVAVDHIVHPSNQTRVIEGRALPDAVLQDLGRNPVGRQVLDGLRDRGGAVRLPAFFVRNERMAIAAYDAPYDSVFIGEGEARTYAPTVDAFLADPAAQARYVHENQSTIAHELEHAVQARRSIFEPGQFGDAIEYEWEAYITEHFYTHAALLQDPHAKGLEIGAYESALEDLDAYLREIQHDSAYKHDFQVNSPRYQEWSKKLHADWPAHRVEAYRLLARRYADNPKLAERYLKAAAKAEAASKK